MSKKSMKQYKQKFEVPKKEVKKKKNEVLAWLLAGFMILWTIMGVLGTIGFFKSRNIESASASEVVEVVDEKSTTKRIKDKQKSLYVGSSMDEQVVNLDFCKGSQLVFSNTSFTFILSLMGEVDLILNGQDMFIDYSYVDTSNMNIVRERYNIMDDEQNVPIRFYRTQGVSPVGTTTLNVGFFLDWNIDRVVDTDNGDYLSSYQISSFILNNNGTYNTSAELEVSLFFKTGYFGNITVERTLYVYFYLPSTAINFTRFFVPTYGLAITPSTSIFPISYWQHAGDWVSSFDLYQTGYEQGLEDGYADGRSDGFSVGYEDGYADGEQDGYADGRSDGYNVGFADGHADGVEDANVYTFKGLLGAVFDVPVQTFQGLFNFEILGVNLSGFLMAILTIMIILAVIKLII